MLILCVGGCPLVGLPGSGGGVPDDGANATFDTATARPLATDDTIHFEGFISGPNDVDLYDLGTLAPGDRLFVSVVRTGGNLDAVAALFDHREYIHAFNDDRRTDATNLNPKLDLILRGPAGTYFLGIAAFPAGRTSGSYEVTVEVTRGVGVPDPQPQVVFLDWDGGRNIRVENVGVFNLDPFDAADLGPYEGQTDQLKDRVQQIVTDRYEGFNLLLLNSDDHAVPTVPHSAIYFGGRDRHAFAISEQIDTFNADKSDNTVVFTESYRHAFSRTASFEDMATAVGNTVAHEIGHLLGLVHTADCSSLMDTACGNDSILAGQAFKLAPLDSTIFPLGWQNALELLAWTIGLAGV